MKTYAHINEQNDVVGIGMIYLTSGEFTPGVAQLAAQLGEDAGILAAGQAALQDKSLKVIIIDTDELPGGNGFAFDKTFRNAFKHGGGGKVVEDVARAKEITHERRRAKRAAELSPLDIEATIPAKAAQAESKRQTIRDKHAVLQSDIDDCTTPEQLKAVIKAAAL